MTGGVSAFGAVLVRRGALIGRAELVRRWVDGAGDGVSATSDAATASEAGSVAAA